MKTPADLPCACTQLRKASRAVSRFYDEALASTGLTSTQFAILRHVSRLQQAPLSRLAESLVMDRTSLYRTLAPMEREGWLSVVPGPGRSKVAQLTAAGQARMEAAAGPWAEAQASFMSRFGLDGWPEASAALERIIGTMRD